MNISVFLADDHAVIRDGLKYLLEAEPDIRVIGEASDGRETIRDVVTLSPDVTVMDIAMPGMNGIEAARRIRKACPRTGIVMLSVYSTLEHICRSLEAGANAYVLKESAGEELISAVRSVRFNRRYFSRKIAQADINAYLARRCKESPLKSLSAREREVLQLVVEGNTSARIAETLSLSPKTVETYRSRLMEKLNLKDLPALVKFAVQHGLTPPG